MQPQQDYTVTVVAWDDPEAAAMRDAMDVELVQRYGHLAAERAEVLRAALTVDPATVVTTVLVRDGDGAPVGHAAVRRHGDEWEVKRVVVRGDQRGRGVGRMLMGQVEAAARADGATRVILQTGHLQPDAVALYERLGYTPIPLYPPYDVAMPEGFCFEKQL